MKKTEQKILMYMLEVREMPMIQGRCTIHEIVGACGKASEIDEYKRILDRLCAHNLVKNTYGSIALGGAFELTENGVDKALELRKPWYSKVHDNKWVYLVIGALLAVVLREFLPPLLRSLIGEFTKQ